MITFESEYKNFNQRLFSLKNLLFLVNLIVISSVIIIFNLSIFYIIIIELFLLTIFVFIIINRSKSNIDIISFKENNIILNGETFNTKWEKIINIKETQIEIQSIGSKQGLRGAIFYLILKNKKDNYIINSFETYSDEGIMQIFNEFKKFKDEKIIIDERLVLLRIQEKIEKCQ
ncbi:hypothetical protein SGQ44_06680 [Flavobacterium sp. Fl-77]|uniref:Uncharacterized protein n=1 Tax=Flavobacterium flavipigmentatum TaxID=2893884 RepID=A0AAJ2SEC7_9FLAO|nr:MULTISPECIES: hypothetical protein [unclassified Flavobacterium]MDX6181531.1 hypothetical protein [Flavobacterium sp. Fl-33]MDX6185435.1 hypothetical protein [Flavobacterium sp. Fl-77]UFH37538.1 hypothetical protein LNP22_12410 [Flavobacterium sp. F-70]